MSQPQQEVTAENAAHPQSNEKEHVMSSESKSQHEVETQNAAPPQSNEKEHVMSHESKSQSEVPTQNAPSAKEDTMQSNTAPDSAAGTSTDSTKNASTTEKRADFSTDLLQRRGMKVVASAAGNTDADVVAAVGVVQATTSEAQLAGTAAHKAQLDHENALEERDKQEKALRPVLTVANAAFKVNKRGREMLKSWKGKYLWLTALNLVAGAPGSGFTVAAEVLAALGAQAAATQAAAKDVDTADGKAKTAAAAFHESVKRAGAAIIALRALLEYQRSLKAAGITTAAPPSPVPIGGQAVNP